MKLYRLIPATKDYIWGGTKLKTFWHKEAETATIAESWELSFHPDGPSKIGAQIGDPGSEGSLLSERVKREEYGSACAKFPFFPVLVKLIDAADNLSVQVHPSDDYALSREGQFGKTEMWAVVDCEPGSGLYCGFRTAISREEYARRIAEGTLLDVLNFLPVKPGDCYFIPSGTVHAIGKGVTICEIQQNSNLTYRVYDYGRVDKTGKPRPLHIEKAKDVSLLEPYRNTAPVREDEHTVRLAQCPYFTVRRKEVSGELPLAVSERSFLTATVTSGRGTVSAGTGECLSFERGDTFFAPAEAGVLQWQGEGTLLVTTVE